MKWLIWFLIIDTIEIFSKHICIHPKNTGQKQDGSGKIDLKSLSYSIGSFDFFKQSTLVYIK